MCKDRYMYGIIDLGEAEFADSFATVDQPRSIGGVATKVTTTVLIGMIATTYQNGRSNHQGTNMISGICRALYTRVRNEEG